MKRTASTPLIDRIVSWSIDHPLPPIVRYGAAALVIVIVAVVRAAFITSLLPWLLFIPAILGITLILGEGAGVFGSVIATALAAYSIGSTAQPGYLTGPQWAASILFLVIAAVIARFVGELRAAFRRVRAMAIEARQREAFLSGVLASSTDCIKVLDLDGNLTFMSEGGMKVMEVADFDDIRGRAWHDFWQGSGHAQALAALDSARQGQPAHFIGKADTFGGTPRWWDVSVSPIFGEDGTPDRILSVSRDTTALSEAREQQDLLNAELGHRLKNLLALVQSIANQSFRRGGSVGEIATAFAARLAALGSASDVLTASAWQSAKLDQAVEAGLISVHDMRDRIVLNGPSIKLESQVALALTLAVHELTTNACKYGALSTENGTVAIDWHFTPVENTDAGRLSLTWCESNGPVVTLPTHKGFGSVMIERSLRSYFRGETSLEYAPAGVVFKVDAPLTKAAVDQGIR